MFLHHVLLRHSYLVLAFLRLLPSRVGFAERDASRPAFGGSSLVSLTRHTCVGGGPIGGGLSVPCVLERARPRRLYRSIQKRRVKEEAEPPRDKRPRAERSERVRRGACSILKMRSVYLLDRDRPHRLADKKAHGQKTVTSWSEATLCTL